MFVMIVGLLSAPILQSLKEDGYLDDETYDLFHENEPSKFRVNLSNFCKLIKIKI